MSFPYEIKDRLVAQSVGIFGTNIFISAAAIIPIGVGPYLSIIETGGSGASMTQNDTATERPTASLIVRAKDGPTARTMAAAAYAAVGGRNGLHNITLTGVFYLSLKPRQNVTDIGVVDGYAMFSFTVDAEKAPS